MSGTQVAIRDAEINTIQSSLVCDNSRLSEQETNM